MLQYIKKSLKKQNTNFLKPTFHKKVFPFTLIMLMIEIWPISAIICPKSVILCEEKIAQ